MASGHPQETMQLRVGFAGAEPEVLRTALRVESASHRDRLQQRGFPGSVFADEKRDCRMELQLFQRRTAASENG